jgi:hypothetical protein
MNDEAVWEVRDRILASIAASGRKIKIPLPGRLRIYDEQNELAMMLAVEFGRRHGWQVSGRPFTIRQLRTQSYKTGDDDEDDSFGHDAIFDHPYYYRESRGRYLPAALAVHVYDIRYHRKEIAAFAANHGLKARVVPEKEFPSWWYPGRTRLVLYLPPRPRPRSRRRRKR